MDMDADYEGFVDRDLSRRSLLRAAALGLSVSALAGLDLTAGFSRAEAVTPAPTPSDMQYDIGRFLPPATPVSEAGATPGVLFGHGPAFTLFVTAALTRTPTPIDRSTLTKALATIESRYPWGPAGVFTFVSYGIPYFARLPGGFHGTKVSRYMPRLLSDPSRYVLEEAVPAPTDIHPSNPFVTKPRFNVPVKIESNDVLFTFRSDVKDHVYDAMMWLAGSNSLAGVVVPSPKFTGLFSWTSNRLFFGVNGMPRQLASQYNLPYQSRINPNQPMWMGFADGVASAFGPPAICSFQGNPELRLTTAAPTDYFANGSIQVLNHVILDLAEFYLTNASEHDPFSPDVGYLERVQYMYRPNRPDHFGFADQFTDGGGPGFLDNRFQGNDDVFNGLNFGFLTPGVTPDQPRQVQTHKILGHIQCLHRSSRTPAGTPIHIRIDGSGFDSMDVPDGSMQPKLQFSAMVPTAQQFRQMRIDQASPDLWTRFPIQDGDKGLEPRITATRRQNFLMPSRAHRAFPLLEALP
jgi:hypothetical protein